jgi:17beta-estradiol 17-dehydrogenase / very-long-chain 3-oxoacyl-CoA reductase
MAATAALLHAAGWAGASQPLLDAVAAEPGGIASLSGTLLALGLAALLALGLAVVRMLLRLLELLRMLVTKPDLDRLCGSGTWACVTGATDGIGRAYALELASQGMPVLLLSRTEGKLEATAAEVRALGVECDWLAVDMSRGEEIYPVIRAFLSNYDVGFLVNNVGASYDHAEFFAELPAPKVQELLNMNIQTATMLCHAVLPQMAERSAGVIVNVSSWLGSRPCGLYAVYSASKAYVDVFSRALAQEYGPSGVTVQSLMPQFVVSKLSKMRRASRPVPSRPVPSRALPCPALPCPALPCHSAPCLASAPLRAAPYACVCACARACVSACDDDNGHGGGGARTHHRADAYVSSPGAVCRLRIAVSRVCRGGQWWSHNWLPSAGDYMVAQRSIARCAGEHPIRIRIRIRIRIPA